MGAAIAHAFAARGMRVALGARRVDRLEVLAAKIEGEGGAALAVPLDVGEAASVDTCFDAVESHWGPVDVVVSNAGVCTPRWLEETTSDDLHAQVATNLLGPMYVARRAIPSMRARASGDLVFISSEAARVPRPFQAAYSASKAGVETLAQTLRMELEGSGVRVSTIRMGPTSTEFGSDWDAATLQRILAAWKHFGLQRHLQFLAPAAIAAAVVNAVTAPSGAGLALVELQPEAPLGSGGSPGGDDA
jgi:NADP-dependent 3-hydroxy acid dehydrogenase YdfG